MSFETAVQNYVEYGREIKKLEALRRHSKNVIVDTMVAEGETSIVLDDGTKVTMFQKAVKDMPLDHFIQIIENDGVEALYNICRVVQTRLSSKEKAALVEVGKQAPQIRVS